MVVFGPHLPKDFELYTLRYVDSKNSARVVNYSPTFGICSLLETKNNNKASAPNY